MERENRSSHVFSDREDSFSSLSSDDESAAAPAPNWLLSSDFLEVDDESEEGILADGGRDASDRYVAIGGPPKPNGFGHYVLSESRKVDLEASFVRLWSLWSPSEQDRFFSALKRYGRLQPREISRKIGSKTPEQVSRILYFLEMLRLGTCECRFLFKSSQT